MIGNWTHLGLGFGLPFRVVGDVSTIEVAVKTILTGDATINSYISGRVFPNVIPQGESMPAITYQVISGNRDLAADGATGLANPRFQVNCWATTYKTAKELMEAVRLAMNAFSGTISSVVIHLISLEGESDIPVITSGTDIKTRFGKRLDLMIWCTES